jgi:hypothetical protein
MTFKTIVMKIMQASRTVPYSPLHLGVERVYRHKAMQRRTACFVTVLGLLIVPLSDMCGKLASL